MPIHQYSMRDDKTYKPLGDNRHIIFVNGENKDVSTRLGKLVHDFKCTSADDMYYNVLAKRVRHFKETEGGAEHMCKLLEDMRNETAEKVARETSILTTIETLRDINFAESEIKKKIILKYKLTDGMAAEYMAKKSA